MSEVLKSEDYSERLLAGLKSLQDSDLLSDLVLVAEDQQVKVHKTVMAAASDYFRALLTLDMKEKNQDVVTLKGVPIKGLRELVSFAYTGKLQCTLGNIADILLAATHLQFADATQLCTTYLTNLTSKVNSVDMYNLAEQFGLLKLQDKAMAMILQNFELIASTEDFCKFNDKFLCRLLADNRLRVSSELRLYQLVQKWIEYNRDQRLPWTAKVMNNVRFPLIPTADLVEHIMNDQLMKTDLGCLELVLEANKYHMLPDRQPLMQNARTQVRSDVASVTMLDVDDEGPRAYDFATRSWVTLPFSNVETYHAQVCTLNNYMYICGGIELYASNNPVCGRSYRFDPRFGTWMEIASMKEPRHHFALVSDSKSLYAIGGYSGGTHKSAVEQYIVSENKWVSKTSMEVRMSALAAAMHQGAIFVSGGQTDRNISRCLWCYHIERDYWYGKSPMPCGRMDHSMECYKNKLYVIGGYDKNIIKAYDVDTVMCYDIELDQWTLLRDGCPRISAIHSCLVGSRIYTVGGFSYDENKKRNEVLCYDITMNEWYVVAKIPVPAMSVPCCALYLPRKLFRDVTV